mgnify:CR=1 FL=1
MGVGVVVEEAAAAAMAAAARGVEMGVVGEI